MKVAILGAPEAGKSKFAEELAKMLNWPYVMDDYIESIEDYSDIAIRDYMATYLGNLHVASYRLMEEDATSKDWESFIVVGTMVETLVHTTLWHLMSQRVGSDPIDRSRGMVTLELLAIMLRDTWNYDLAFYLPYSKDMKLDKAGMLDEEVNHNIKVTLDAFKLPYVIPTTVAEAAAMVIQEEALQSELEKTE